ncbi:MAG: Hcp family type VI secretion system effector [Verrucomicrobiaceae bacterium]
MKLRSYFKALILMVAIVPIPSVQAAQFYLKLGDIKGEARAEGFEGWIKAESLGFDGIVAGKGGGAIRVMKRIDAATPLILTAISTGKYIRQAEIVLIEDGKEGEVRNFAVLKLRDVVIAGVSQEVLEKGEGHLEEVTLAFRTILFSYPSADGEDSPKVADLGGDLDSDGDGMTDDYERFHGFDPAVNDSGLDSDKDGLTNYQEFKLGLNPKSARSLFETRGRPSSKDPSKFRLEWETKPGTVYDVYFTSDLGEPFKFIERITAADFDTAWEVGTGGLKGFYQVRSVLE